MNVGTPESWILEVRQRLAEPAPQRLANSPDLSEVRQAAVLVPLYVDAGQLWVVLTRRSDELPHHRSQIAFPGGALESGEDRWEAALRETDEEIGLAAEKVVRLGELDEVLARVSDFRIVPCVGAVPFPLATTLNRDEIAEVFSVPLLAFANPRLVEDRTVVVDGREQDFRMYHVGNRPVWGLTARIVQLLMGRLGMS